MSIFKFEFASVKKTVLTWCVILLVTFYVLIAGIYPMFEEGSEQIVELLAQMSSEYLAVFGLDVDNMVGFQSFYSFSSIYINLVAATMASSISLKIFGREKKSHCQEFLFAKPVKRSKIFLSKFMAVTVWLCFFNLVAIPFSLYCFAEYGEIDGNSILATLSIPLCQVVFMGLSIFLAVFIPKIRSTATITATISILSFTIAVFVNSLQIKWLEFFSPLQFFSPKYVFEHGGYDIGLAIYGLILSFFCVMMARSRFLHADLSKL